MGNLVLSRKSSATPMITKGDNQSLPEYKYILKLKGIDCSTSSIYSFIDYFVCLRYRVIMKHYGDDANIVDNVLLIIGGVTPLKKTISNVIFYSCNGFYCKPHENVTVFFSLISDP